MSAVLGSNDDDVRSVKRPIMKDSEIEREYEVGGEEITHRGKHTYLSLREYPSMTQDHPRLILLDLPLLNHIQRPKDHLFHIVHKSICGASSIHRPKHLQKFPVIFRQLGTTKGS